MTSIRAPGSPTSSPGSPTTRPIASANSCPGPGRPASKPRPASRPPSPHSRPQPVTVTATASPHPGWISEAYPPALGDDASSARQYLRASGSAKLHGERRAQLASMEAAAAQARSIATSAALPPFAAPFLPPEILYISSAKSLIKVKSAARKWKHYNPPREQRKNEWPVQAIKRTVWSSTQSYRPGSRS